MAHGNGLGIRIWGPKKNKKKAVIFRITRSSPSMIKLEEIRRSKGRMVLRSTLLSAHHQWTTFPVSCGQQIWINFGPLLYHFADAYGPDVSFPKNEIVNPPSPFYFFSWFGSFNEKCISPPCHPGDVRWAQLGWRQEGLFSLRVWPRGTHGMRIIFFFWLFFGGDLLKD